MEDTCGFGFWRKTSEEILRKQFPLHRACRDGDVEALSLLLVAAQHGIYSEDGFYAWTPAHWAAYFGKLNCLMKLLEHGMNCDVTTTRFNQTPAHIASFSSHSHCLKWLLHCGAAINKQDYLGETPVHKAARTGTMECVSLLSSHGAQLTIANHGGKTPEQVARNGGFHDCANYLQHAVQYQHQSRAHLPPGVPNTTAVNAQNGTEMCIISQGINGGLIPNNRAGGGDSADINDDEMDTGECTAHNVVINGACANGIGNGFCHTLNGLQNGHYSISNGSRHANGFLEPPEIGAGDILLNGGVSRNDVPVAGRKRAMEDIEENGPKRLKKGEPVVRHTCQSLPVQLTAESQTLVRADMLTTSAVEHESSCVQQTGYDSMLYESMIVYNHGF